MINSVVASLALFGASASALSVGKAHVVNQCSYDVYLCNVPSAGGGYEQEDKTLSSGGTWDQEWTQLSNTNGWSIKLSTSEALENILQYEYTFHNDGTIWYDLSCVNGNPWDGNWEITASGSNCNPKQQAYRYATDDAYGMQSCPQDSSITVTLCSGEAAGNSTSGSGSDSGSDSGSSSASSTEASTSEATSYSAPAYSTPASTPSLAMPSAYINWNDGDASSSSAAAAAAYAQTTPTTFATSTTAVVTEAPNGVTVTEVETAVVTNIVTAYAGRVKPRHEHHAHRHQQRHA